MFGFGYVHEGVPCESVLFIASSYTQRKCLALYLPVFLSPSLPLSFLPSPWFKTHQKFSLDLSEMRKNKGDVRKKSLCVHER